MKSVADILPKPCTAAWMTLLGLTLATFHLGFDSPGRALMTTVLALTLFKGQLVISYFMGLRRSRPLWRLIMTGYLAVIAGIVALAYLSA